MTSIDTNILLNAFSEHAVGHPKAMTFMNSITLRNDIVLCEFVLAEFYQLLRNPAVLPHALNNTEACEVISTYRSHPHWQIVGYPPESKPLHDTLWKKIASTPNFARRRLFDLRIALILQSFGVTKFATANTKDFQNLGFKKVWNPLR